MSRQLTITHKNPKTRQPEVIKTSNLERYSNKFGFEVEDELSAHKAAYEYARLGCKTHIDYSSVTETWIVLISQEGK